MTTHRPAHEGHSSDVAGAESRGAAVTVPVDVLEPDRETLSRVLERLRDLPERPAAGQAPDPRRPTEVGAVPLPRRRPERWAPSVD